MRAHPVGPQIQHLLLELVLHVPTRTVKLLIQLRRPKALPVFAPKPLPRQVGHDEPGIVSAAHHLSLAHHPARAAPTLAGLILQVPELPGTRGTGQTPPPARRGQSVLNHRHQARIRPQSQAIIHHRLLRLTPRHNLFPPKGAVLTDDAPDPSRPHTRRRSTPAPRKCGTPRRFPSRKACAPSGPETACRLWSTGATHRSEEPLQPAPRHNGGTGRGAYSKGKRPKFPRRG